MKVGYTEFSFGYAFTENLIRSASGRPGAAPHFPNLVQEGELGYDVYIDLPGRPLFFQFKLPERMVKNSAAEVSKYSTNLTIPFFRIALMRRDLSDQHQTLIDLEGRFPDCVAYAAPAFKGTPNFSAAYLSAQVHSHSFFFSPSDIGPLPDNKQHTVAYQDGLQNAWLCSAPESIRAKRWEDVEGGIRDGWRALRTQSLSESIERVKEDVLQAAPPEVRVQEPAIRERIRSRRLAIADRPSLEEQTVRVAEEILVTREIARIGLGLEMVVAQPRSAVAVSDGAST